MSKTLNIDNQINWIPTYKQVLNGEKPTCPICGGSNIESVVEDKHDVGYVVITCKDCNKTGYFSRVNFAVRKDS